MWGPTNQDCFSLAGQQLYLKSHQVGVGGGADSRGAAATGKKNRKKK